MGRFKVKDHYYNKAKKQDFLARSVFKLEEIDNKFKVLSKGQRVIDLGYYPGSWIQYTSKKIGEDGFVFGIDIQGVNKKLFDLKNVKVIERDIFSISNLDEIEMEDSFDVLLSNMAPNTTGVRSVDQIRSLNLIEKVFEIMPVFLKEGGSCVLKVFDGHEAQVFLKEQKKRFEKFDYLKPKSTRSVSKEFFVIGRGFKA